VKLAICTAGEVFGGVERHVLGLCQYASRQGSAFPLLVLFCDCELARQARHAGIEPVILASESRYDPRLARALADALVAHEVTVVHAHGYKAMIACALARRLVRSRHQPALSIIKTEHGKLEPMDGNLPGWGRLGLYRAVDVLATRAAAKVVCYVSNDLAGSYARLHRRMPRTVIPNGIDPLERSMFRRPADLESSVPQIGMVGRITRVKGAHLAIRALADPVVPPETVLNIIGTGPQERSLRAQAEALGISARVRFLGFRPNIWDYVAHLDALLLPSLHEGLPYTLLEAMSLQTPIIASNTGGLAEVLRDGETALLFEPGNVNELARHIATALRDRACASTVGAAAASVQRREYTLDRMGDSYWRLYESAARFVA
jgi:glycosyltransferase involved in cell wall biosynthesis